MGTVKKNNPIVSTKAPKKPILNGPGTVVGIPTNQTIPFGGIGGPNIKPKTNQAQVGAGAVAPVSQQQKPVDPKLLKAPQMMSEAPMMSTNNGVQPGYVGTPPKAPVTNTNVKTNTATPSGGSGVGNNVDMSRITKSNAGAQLRAGNITQEQYNSIMNPSTPTPPAGGGNTNTSTPPAGLPDISLLREKFPTLEDFKNSPGYAGMLPAMRAGIERAYGYAANGGTNTPTPDNIETNPDGTVNNNQLGIDTTGGNTTTPTGAGGFYTDDKGMKQKVLGYDKLPDEFKSVVDGMTDAQKKQINAIYGADLNAQTEYLRQYKRETEYNKDVRGLTIQIRDKEGQILNIQSSQRLQDARRAVDNIKQNIAYLGSMGAPGKSQAKADAMILQIADAEGKFAQLKQIEQYTAEIRELGLDIDTKGYEKQMADLADQLDKNVNKQIQSALNDFTAADLAGQLDSIDGIQQFKRTLLEKLDNSITGYTQASFEQMKYVNDTYTKIADDATTRIQEYQKNQNTVNVEMSTAKGMYIDGNGSPILNSSGKPIVMLEKPPMDPIFDKDSGKLITFATGADGSIVASVQQVLKSDTSMAGTAAKSYAQAILDGTWTSAQVPDAYKDLVATYLANPEMLTNETSGGVNAPAVDPAQVQAALQQINSLGNGGWGGQCGSFVNNYLQDLGLGRLFVDPIDKKKAVMNSDTPTIGSVVVMNSPTKPEYGHVGIVQSINGNKITIKQSNANGDEKIFTSTLDTGNANILGYFDPTLGGGTAGGTTGGDQNYLYGKFIETLTPQGAAAFNGMNESDKLNVMQIINGDALVSDIAKGMKGGVYAQKLLGLATKVDPTFSENKNKSRFNFVKRWDDPAGKPFINRTTINTALGHTAELAEAVKELDNTTVNKANTFKNIIKNNLGNSAVPDFQIIMTAIAGEMAGLYKGASPTDQETEKWYNSISSSYSPRTFSKLLNRVQSLAADRIRSMTSEYQSTMGKLPDDSIVQDYFLQRLKDAGVDTTGLEAIPGALGGGTATTSTPTNANAGLQDLRNNL